VPTEVSTKVVRTLGPFSSKSGSFQRIGDSRGSACSFLDSSGTRKPKRGYTLHRHALWQRERDQTILRPVPPHPDPLPEGEGIASAALGLSECAFTP